MGAAEMRGRDAASLQTSRCSAAFQSPDPSVWLSLKVSVVMCPKNFYPSSVVT